MGSPYGRQWRKKRKAILDRDPFCVRCLPSRVEEGEHVDHMVPRRLWSLRKWHDTLQRLGAPSDPDDPRNLRTLCRRCHGRKTAQSDGAFGRPAVVPVAVEWNQGQWSVDAIRSWMGGGGLHVAAPRGGDEGVGKHTTHGKLGKRGVDP